MKNLQPRTSAKRRAVLILSFFSVLLLSLPCFGQEKVKFPLSVSAKALGYAPLWVASKQGFFDRQDLDVQLILVAGTDKTMMALAGGSVLVSAGAMDATVGAVEHGMDVVAIGGVVNGVTHFILGGKNYKSYGDLRGATIGSSSLTSGTALVLQRVLKSKGLEYPRDYKLINVGGSVPSFAALSSGQIGATMLAVPLNFEAAERGFNAIGRVMDVIPNYQLVVLSVKRSWAEKNRPLLVRFMKAMVLSMRWIYENKEPAIEFLTKEMKLKPAHARKGWEFYIENRIWHPEVDLNIEGIQIVIQIYGEQSQLKGALPAPAKYVDQSYLKEAIKELDKKR